MPDGTRHWFDMGPEPAFTCIRLFTNPEGWVADFTGEDIASRLPRYERLAGVAG
jgi:1,2-dihydroxy-3-keto-5-methylthiopentene dioxygenase